MPPSPQSISVLTGQATSVSVQQVVQLGMFSIITYAGECGSAVCCWCGCGEPDVVWSV